MSRIRTPIPALLHDERGATIVEFGFILVPMCVLLLGTLDLGYQSYVKAILDGTVQKAARDSTIVDNGDTTAIDNKVKTEVQKIAQTATFTFSRKSYSNYSGVGKPEKYKDANSNGKYDSGECFEDINGNGSWDADMGKTGLGGADDITYYEVQISYPRVVPIVSFIGGSNTITIKSMAVLRNQPYAAQVLPTVTTCPAG